MPIPKSLKKIFFLLIIPFVTVAAFGQSKKSPAITKAFTDSLTVGIQKIMPSKYTMSILYVTPVSKTGKVMDPKIWRQADFDGTQADNDFVVKLRQLILQCPEWKPAMDEAGHPVPVNDIYFTVLIKKGKIKISEAEKNSMNRH